MPENNKFSRIMEGVFINGLYDIIKLLFVGAVVALVVALWQRIKHVPIDWWGILALSLFVCVLFALMLRLQRPQVPVTLEVPAVAPEPQAIVPAPAPEPTSMQARPDPMTPIFEGLMTGRMRSLRVNGKKGRFTWLNTIGDTFFEPEQKGKDSSKALIAEFRNEPGQFSVTTWYSVVASIAYYDKAGNELADVGRATWLEGIGTAVAMESHVTHKLLVAVRAKGAWVSFDGNDARALPDGITRARIILHDNGKFSLPWTLDFDWETGEVGPLVSLIESQEYR